MHIPVSSVIYIESIGHEVLVHTKDGVYMSSGRLIQLEKSAGFMKFSHWM